MERDLTEFNKLEDWLRDHAAEYGLEYTRYDNENAYKGKKEIEECFNHQPVDVHIIHVYKYNGERLFTALCECASLGSENGLIQIIGEIAAKGGLIEGEEGYLQAGEIIERVEHELYKKAGPAV